MLFEVVGALRFARSRGTSSLVELSPRRFLEVAFQTHDHVVFYSGHFHSIFIRFIVWILLVFEIDCYFCVAVFKFLESRNVLLRKSPEFTAGQTGALSVSLACLDRIQ